MAFLQYADGMIDSSRFDELISYLNLGWQVFNGYEPRTQIIGNTVLYHAIDKLVKGETVDFPTEKPFVKFTTKSLPAKVDDWDGEHSTTDGAFGHVVLVCTKEQNWNQGILPETYKKNAKSTSALTRLLGAKTEVYIDKALQTSFIFSLAPLEQCASAVACLLSEIAPWLAPKPEAGSDAMALLTAIKLNKSGEYKSLMAKQFTKFNDWYTPQKMKLEFDQLSERINTELVDKYRRQMDDGLARIRDWTRRIAAEQSNIYETSRIYEALKSGSGEDDNVARLRDAFGTYKSLKYRKTEGNTIYFSIYEPLTAWNVTEFETRYRNTSSTVYAHGADLAKFLYGVISKQRFDIWCECDMLIDLTGSIDADKSTYSSAGNDKILRRNPNAFPHPHIVYYNCLGSGNVGDMEEFMRKGDYVSAVEQAIAAAAGVNVHESATFEPFMSLLKKVWSTQKCVSADGVTFYTPSEAYEIMKEEGIVNG